MYRIRKVFRFEAAHILTDAYSQECKDHIHGHSFVVEVFLQAEKLNADGMIIDFKYLKELIGHIIDSLDHKFITDEKDVRLRGDIQLPFNPTAENLAHYLFTLCSAACSLIYKIRVHETTTGWAEYEK